MISKNGQHLALRVTSIFLKLPLHDLQFNFLIKALIFARKLETNTNSKNGLHLALGALNQKLRAFYLNRPSMMS